MVQREARLDTADEDGSVARFRFGEDGLRNAEGTSWRWRNFALADTRARRSIEEEVGLPAAARATLLSADDPLLVDFDEGWLHGAIVDTRHRHYTDAREIAHLRFAFNDSELITARRHPLQSVDDVRHLVEQRKKSFRRPCDLLESIVVHALERLAGELTTVSGELDQIEDRIVDENWRSEGEKLAAARRRLVFVHRHVASVHGLFRHVEHIFQDDLPPHLSDMVARLASRAIALLHDSEQLQSRARLMQDEIMALLSAESNRLLYALSMMTAVLLPMTIITGLFGMNVGGIPLGQSHAGFWVVSILSVAVAASVYFGVRRLGRGR